MKNIKLLSLIILSVMMNSLNIVAFENKKLNILNEFPNEKEIEKYNYVLYRGYFHWDNEHIYFCSQPQNRVFIIDFNGNLINIIGKKGQGPGEFNLPLFNYYYNGRLYVTDNWNARIQVFDKTGAFVRMIKLPDQLGGLIIINNKIILSHIPNIDEQRDRNGNYHLLGIYDMNGNRERSIYSIFKSVYRIPSMDNAITIREYNGNIHCLQQYGTTYRIFDLEGNIIKNINLESDPLKNEDHKRTNYKFAYKTFCTDGHHIYVPLDMYGKICICEYDMNGHLINRLISERSDKNEIYDVMDIGIREMDGNKYLYIFIMNPEDIFLVAKVD